MTLYTADDQRSEPAQAREVFDVSGAGDTVFAVMLAAGLDLWDAVRIVRGSGERYDDYTLETVAQAVLGTEAVAGRPDRLRVPLAPSRQARARLSACQPRWHRRSRVCP